MADGGAAIREAIYTRPPLAKYQLDAIFHQVRYGLIEASTKAGKTAGCLVWLYEQALQGQPGWNYWWVAPVYTQAKIAFRRMKAAIPKELYSANETELTITLRPKEEGKPGCIIWFKSAEKPDNLYGEDVHAAVIDEASRCREESWHAVRSTLTATRGAVRIIGNVKGRLNWAYKLCRKAEAMAGDKKAAMRYARITALDAVKAGIITADEVEDARATLPRMAFEELYMAKPCPPEGRVFNAFEYGYNVRSDIDDMGGTVLVGMDFNIDPMSCVLCSRIGNELHIWGELCIKDANTEVMGLALKEHFPGRRIVVYPDPTGRRGQTNAQVGETDHKILRRHGFEVVLPRDNKNIPVVDRLNETNALFCTADGTRRCFINPRCENLIEGLEGLLYVEGTRVVDKSMGIDHLPDALGYLIHSEFPIVQVQAGSQKLRVG